MYYLNARTSIGVWSLDHLKIQVPGIQNLSASDLLGPHALGLDHQLFWKQNSMKTRLIYIKLYDSLCSYNDYGW